MIEKYLAWIEADIAKQEFGESPQSLYDPIRYIMRLGGKRLRPLLTLMAFALYRTNPKKVVSLATAVESFHNFTLLHDDIMDNAPLRRGKATVHHRWNINTAILSGDVMLVKVYDQLLRVKPALLREVLALFNACAAQVCEGQQWDMEYENSQDVPEQDYIQMVKKKTAVLLGFSLEFGALLAGAPKRDRVALRNFGIDMGIGFQLKDDWLDVYANKKKFGKQVGGDILANKKTYLLITALAKAKGKDKKELLAWINAKQFNKKEKIKSVTALYDRLEVGLMTSNKINFYVSRGLSQLEKLSVSSRKLGALKGYTLQLIDRTQ